MNSLASNTAGDELEASAAYCKSEGIGLEVTAFAFPANLDGNENWSALLSAATVHAPDAVLVAESGRLDKNQMSIQRLRSFQPCPEDYTVTSGLVPCDT